MNNLVILPILIPMVTGIILIFFYKIVKLQRIISGISSIVTLLVSFTLLQQVYTSGIQTLEIGGWKAPYGIVLVADMFSALLVVTTGFVTIGCLFFAFRSIGEERERFFFYPLVHFMVLGVTGAFLTGDIFNLFVFFEVLLMASYGLIVLGGTKVQFSESMKYILVNVISSALFVIAVAYLYSVTGTLNMAHLSERVAEIGQNGILTTISILFLVVFGLKGAIFPLFLWLPGSYNAPPPVITALFGALLTKVGLYAIARTFTLIFYHNPDFTHQFIAVIASITIAAGVIGAVAYWDIKKIIIYNIVTAVGVILFGFSVMNHDAVAGAIFYIVHDMIIKAALFLLAGAVIAITGTSNVKQMGGLIKNHPALGWMFFIAAISLVGVPPFSGFVGKLLIIRGGFDAGQFVFGGIVLGSSLLVLYSMMKIFLNGFFGETKLSTEEEGSAKGLLFPCALLVALSTVIGLGAETVISYIDMAAQVLLDPSIYIQSVLKE